MTKFIGRHRWISVRIGERNYKMIRRGEFSSNNLHSICWITVSEKFMVHIWSFTFDENLEDSFITQGGVLQLDSLAFRSQVTLLRSRYEKSKLYITFNIVKSTVQQHNNKLQTQHHKMHLHVYLEKSVLCNNVSFKGYCLQKHAKLHVIFLCTFICSCVTTFYFSEWY